MIAVTLRRERRSDTCNMPNDRVRTKIPAEFEADGFRGRGEVRNVSQGGLFVGTLHIPEEGACVELRMQQPGTEFGSCSGESGPLDFLRFTNCHFL